jgi:hypothetical protein
VMGWIRDRKTPSESNRPRSGNATRSIHANNAEHKSHRKLLRELSYQYNNRGRIWPAIPNQLGWQNRKLLRKSPYQYGNRDGAIKTTHQICTNIIHYVASDDGGDPKDELLHQCSNIMAPELYKYHQTYGAGRRQTEE